MDYEARSLVQQSISKDVERARQELVLLMLVTVSGDKKVKVILLLLYNIINYLYSVFFA